MIVILLWWMFTVDSRLAALLLPAPLFFCLAMVFFSTKMFKISEALQTYNAVAINIVVQIVSGSNSIKIFLLNSLVKQRFSKSISHIATQAIQQDVANAKMQSVWTLVMIPYQALFFLIAGWMYIQGGTPSIGTILAFSNFSAFLIYPLMALLGNVSHYWQYAC